jgi:hypothetical protein
LLHRSQRIATAHLVIASTVLGDRAGITGAAANGGRRDLRQTLSTQW